MSTAAIENHTTVTPPAGSHFEYEEVSTKNGTESLGDVPILVWDNLDGALAHYGEEGVLAALDGTSLRVSFQGIARRFAIAKKDTDTIAQALVDFKPGKRTSGATTPGGKAAGAVRRAIQADPSKADKMQRLIEAIASGQVDIDSLLK